MYTNKMRMTGLSGLDTESMVKQLMKAESMKLISLKKARQVNVWRQEQYRAAAKSLKTYQDTYFAFGANSATNFRSKTNYTNITATVKLAGTQTLVSNAGITTTEDAKVGTYDVLVKQIAQKDVYTSTTALHGAVKGAEDFNLANLKAGDKFSVTLDGVSKQIELTAADLGAMTSNADFESFLNTKLEAAFGKETVNGSMVSKVSASFEGNRLVVSTGPGHTVSLGGATRSKELTTFTGTEITPATGDYTTSLTVSVGGVSKTIDVDIKEGDDAAKIANAINKALKDEELSGLSVSAANGKLTFNSTSSRENVEISIDTGGAAAWGVPDYMELENTSVFADMGLTSNLSSNLNMKDSVANIFGVSGTFSFEINDEVFTFDSTDSVEYMMNKINNSNIGVKMSYSNLTGKFAMESAKTGGVNAIRMTDTDGFLAGAFGFTQTSTAQDAVVSVNGVITTRDTNDFTIEGIRMNLTASSVNAEGYTVEVTKDYTKTVDFIKSFVAEYNKMVDTLRGYYNTARAKSDKYSYYEPLSDEEKEALSDREIERYEEKAKEGLLYRDPIISGISSAMRSMLYESVEFPDGTKLSLYEIGITTTKSFNDGGKIELDEARLNKALEEKGDKVIDLFTQSSDITYANKAQRGSRMKTQGIAERMNDIIRDAIDTNGTIYMKAGIPETGSQTKNYMQTLITEQDQKISDMLALLAKKEDNYYMMFSKLETAMTQANNQMSSLIGMLGLE